MASVIASARQSTSSVFDVITRSAETITGLLDAAQLSADMLVHKARTMHSEVVVSSIMEQEVRRDQLVLQAATRHTDIVEEAHKRNLSGQTFDRASVFQAACTKLEAALQSK